MGFLHSYGLISFFSVLVPYVMSCGYDIAGVGFHEAYKSNLSIGHRETHIQFHGYQPMVLPYSRHMTENKLFETNF